MIRRATLDRAAQAFDLEQHLAALPLITVSAVTLDDLMDSNFPATNGRPSAGHFTGPVRSTRSRTPATTLPRRLWLHLDPPFEPSDAAA